MTTHSFATLAPWNYRFAVERGLPFARHICAAGCLIFKSVCARRKDFIKIFGIGFKFFFATADLIPSDLPTLKIQLHVVTYHVEVLQSWVASVAPQWSVVSGHFLPRSAVEVVRHYLNHVKIAKIIMPQFQHS